MSRLWTMLISAFLVSFLSSCVAQGMNATVTRFNAWSWNNWGQGFVILPDEKQQGSLQFQAYAAHVSSAFQNAGYKALPPQQAQNSYYVVFITYETGAPKTTVETVETPFGPFASTSGIRRKERFSTGFLGMPGMGIENDYEQALMTTYPHTLSVKIFDGEAFRKGQKVMVFEGQATMDTGSSSISEVMPYLSQALFQKFPGQSGETVKVIVPVRQ